MSGDKSAFSRFTIYAKPSSSSSGASLSSGTSQASSGPARALEALEALAIADADGRMRQATVDMGPRRIRDQSAGSRERQRDKELRLYGGGLVDSPLAGAQPSSRIQASGSGAGSSGYWGGESLPPNASTFSNFAGSAFDGSHFFTPGASGFSFEGDGSSYKSSVGSSSIFRDRFPALEKSSIPEGSYPSLGGSSWDNHSGSRGTSPGALGGGRKRRDASRALSFTLPGTVSGDRGVVGIAKPKEGDHGRVAVAGKTCASSTLCKPGCALMCAPLTVLKILKIPSGEPVTTPPIERVSRPTTTFKSSSSLAYRRAQSRGSPAAVDRSGGSDAYAERKTYREDISETMDVRVGSRLGPGFLFTDVRWGYGGASLRNQPTRFCSDLAVLSYFEQDCHLVLERSGGALGPREGGLKSSW